MPTLKRFAQHWLRCEATLGTIVNSARLTPADIVLEIGGGTGNLTRRLLPLVKGLVVVEIDRRLCQKLPQQFPDPKFHLVEGDILKISFTDLPLRPNKVVANIPYNITGPILEKLLGTIAQPQQVWQTIVLLVQKEIALRLTAQPHDKHKAYGALSVKVQYLADCEYICTVPPTAFYPAPQVDSAVVRLTPRPPQPPAQHPRLLQQIVHLGFSQRRKMLHNNLASLVQRDILTGILRSLGINPQVRAEELSLQEWIALSDRLHEQSGTLPSISHNNLANTEQGPQNST
ncbi:MAG: 16S rRNA (adenine(1518)-N(6)/adenine(1519)-N(6))-dimethyltransferase RsmA [Pseudanabaenaceae cyanobacterium]